MKVLVIGGAGYIGSHVTRELLDQKHSVCVFDNLSSGVRENLFADAHFFHGDILIRESILQCIRQHGPFHTIIHLAASKAAGESMLAPEKYARNNICGTINILNSMTETGMENCVFSSSAAVYGEPRYLPIDEKHPCEPENFYGFTKLEIERILQWYAKLKGLRYAALRYFNAAGYDPGGRIRGLEQNPANLLPVIMEVAVGKREKLSVFGTDYDTRDGSAIRDYVHVSDLSRAHLAAMNHICETRENLSINLGSARGISVLEMLEAARSITGVNIAAEMTGRRPGDPAKLIASPDLAKSSIGWDLKDSDLENLVRSSWKAYRNAFLP